MLVSVGILASFDYEYLLNAIPIIYDDASSITIAIQKGHKTWTGESFYIPEAFFKKIESLDVSKKIKIFEYSLNYEQYSTMECETAVRNMLGEAMPKADWYIQIDADEYFLNFKTFLENLSKVEVPLNGDVTVFGKCVAMLKSDDTGYYTVDAHEEIALATNNPIYLLARKNENNTNVYVNDTLLHQSWDRSIEEVEQKIRNWGHKDDFDVVQYFNFWKSINKYNYKYISNFHPIWPELWKKMIYIPAQNIEQLRSFFISMSNETIPVEHNVENTSVFKIVIQQLVPPFILNLYQWVRLKYGR